NIDLLDCRCKPVGSASTSLDQCRPDHRHRRLRALFRGATIPAIVPCTCRTGSSRRNPQAPAIKREAEEDWGRWPPHSFAWRFFSFDHLVGDGKNTPGSGSHQKDAFAMRAVRSPTTLPTAATT